MDQRTLSSVVLKDPKTNDLVDNGANVPIDQILAGPRRSKIRFEPDETSEVRGIGQMIRREGADLGGPRHRGLRKCRPAKGLDWPESGCVCGVPDYFSRTEGQGIDHS